MENWENPFSRANIACLFAVKKTPNRWLIDKIILNGTRRMRLQYELKQTENIAEELKNRKNRSVFEGTRLVLSSVIHQSRDGKFISKILISIGIQI